MEWIMARRGKLPELTATGVSRRTVLAGLSGLDPQLDEAARVLGANRFSAFEQR